MLVRVALPLLFVLALLVGPGLAQGTDDRIDLDLAETIADTGAAISGEVNKQITVVGGEVRGVVLQLGLALIIAIALALFLGITLGSFIAALVLRRAVREVSARRTPSI